MATYYNEFDSTVGGLIADLTTQITSSSDWTKISSTPTALTTLSAAAGAGTSTLTLPSGHGLVSGQLIAIDSGTNREWRKVASAFGTSCSLNSSTFYAHASGTTIYTANEVLKATTTRGANMILDLVDSENLAYGIQMAAYRSHTGAVGGGTDRIGRPIFWRSGVGTATASSPLHCVVSAGKEHLFVSVEGPRANETGATSTSYGSNKQYLFMSDMVPYNAGDTVPQVFVGGTANNSYTASVSSGSHIGHLTRNYANTASWDPAVLGTVSFPLCAPGGASTNMGTMNLNRQSVIDGKFYMFPYVVFSSADGPRGRLAAFFNAGYNYGYSGDPTTPPPVGAKITYNGVLYKLVPVDHGANNYDTWAQFGSTGNGANATNMYASNVVAVPCT